MPEFYWGLNEPGSMSQMVIELCVLHARFSNVDDGSKRTMRGRGKCTSYLLYWLPFSVSTPGPEQGLSPEGSMIRKSDYLQSGCKESSSCVGADRMENATGPGGDAEDEETGAGSIALLAGSNPVTLSHLVRRESKPWLRACHLPSSNQKSRTSTISSLTNAPTV